MPEQTAQASYIFDVARYMRKLLLVSLLLSAPLYTQTNSWSVIGTGPLSSLPSTCNSNHDVYLCNGDGCPSPNATYYCLNNSYSLVTGSTAGVSDVTVSFRGKRTISIPSSVHHFITDTLLVTCRTGDVNTGLKIVPCNISIGGDSTVNVIFNKTVIQGSITISGFTTDARANFKAYFYNRMQLVLSPSLTGMTTGNINAQVVDLTGKVIYTDISVDYSNIVTVNFAVPQSGRIVLSTK